MPTFAALREIPTTGLNEWESSLLSSMKENIEILTGARVSGAKAVMTDVLASRIKAVDNLTSKQITSTGAGFIISGSSVPSLADYNLLRQDVQTLINDVARVQNLLNNLIQALET